MRLEKRRRADAVGRGNESVELFRGFVAQVDGEQPHQVERDVFRVGTGAHEPRGRYVVAFACGLEQRDGFEPCAHVGVIKSHTGE